MCTISLQLPLTPSEAQLLQKALPEGVPKEVTAELSSLCPLSTEHTSLIWRFQREIIASCIDPEQRLAKDAIQKTINTHQNAEYEFSSHFIAFFCSFQCYAARLALHTIQNHLSKSAAIVVK